MCDSIDLSSHILLFKNAYSILFWRKVSLHSWFTKQTSEGINRPQLQIHSNPNRIRYRLFNNDSQQQLTTEEKWAENAGGRNVCSSQVCTAPLATLKSFHRASPDSDPGPYSQKSAMCDKRVCCCCFLNLYYRCHRKGSFQLEICSIFKHL